MYGCAARKGFRYFNGFVESPYLELTKCLTVLADVKIRRWAKERTASS